MATGLELLLISGGARLIIKRLANEVGDDVLEKLKGPLLNGDPNLAEAQQVAQEHQVTPKLQRTIREVGYEHGVAIEFEEDGRFSFTPIE